MTQYDADRASDRERYDGFFGVGAWEEDCGPNAPENYRRDYPLVDDTTDVPADADEVSDVSPTDVYDHFEGRCPQCGFHLNLTPRLTVVFCDQPGGCSWRWEPGLPLPAGVQALGPDGLPY